MKYKIFILSLSIILSGVNTIAQSGKIYYSDFAGFNFNVYKSNLDGSNREVLTMPQRPNGVAVDWLSNPPKLYIGICPISGGGVKIIRCNTDGSNIEDIVTNLTSVGDIELDLINRKIFWIQDTYADDRIYKANMDGINSEIEQIYSFTTPMVNLWGLALDVDNHLIWFTLRGSTSYSSYIKMGHFNGGTLTNLLHPVDNPHDIEYLDNKIYWGDDDGIKSSNIIGNYVDTIFAGAKVYGLCIDSVNSRLYWTDYILHIVKSVNFDGSNEMDISQTPGTHTYIDTDANAFATEVNEYSINQLSFNLEQNYPNPFNPSTVIRYQLPVGSKGTLKVFDVLGNEIATLVDEYRDSGKYEFEFQSSTDNRRLASGIYFYQLKAVDPSTSLGRIFIQTKKMILLK